MQILEFNPIRLSWVVSDPRHFFWSRYSKSVYLKNTYRHPKKTLRLATKKTTTLRQPGPSSEQVKFALGLERPTTKLTSVQTRFERQGKFWIFMNFMSIFERFFFFWVIYWFFICKHFFFWIFMKFLSIFGRFFFFLDILIFYFKFFFFYDCSWSLWVFLKDFTFFESYIDFSSLIAWRSVHPLKSWELFVHVRNESTIWTI